MKFAYRRHCATAASIVLLLLGTQLLSFSTVEATTTVDNNNYFFLARREALLALTTRKPALARMIRGGASLPPQPKPPLTQRNPVVALERANNKEESAVVESDLTVVLDNNDDVDATATKKARILQAVTFLFVFSFSIVALAPAPALISSLGAEKATTLLSIITGCGALTEILFSSRLGSLLDTKGRKPAFILTMMLMATINSVVAMQRSVPALCLSKFSSILAISIFALSSQAVMSDLSETVVNPEKWLSATIGANMAASGVGFLSGVISAGLLSDRGGGLVTVFAASATVAAVSGLLSILFLPETLPTRKRAATAAAAATTTTPSLPAMMSARQRLRQVLEVPLSSTKLLFRHGPKVRILAILLMLLTLPMYQGDMFQVYSKQEWNLDTKSLSSYLALYGFVGIFANGCGSFLIQRIGTKRFTMLAILSRIISTAGAAFFGYKGAVVGILIGFLGAAQTIGIIAALVSAGTKSGLPQGELAGQRSSLLALLKVVGPFLYSFLYIQGSGVLAMPNLPFIFNIVVSLVALIATQLYLS